MKLRKYLFSALSLFFASALFATFQPARQGSPAVGLPGQLTCKSCHTRDSTQNANLRFNTFTYNTSCYLTGYPIPAYWEAVQTYPIADTADWDFYQWEAVICDSNSNPIQSIPYGMPNCAGGPANYFFTWNQGAYFINSGPVSRQNGYQGFTQTGQRVNINSCGVVYNPNNQYAGDVKIYFAILAYNGDGTAGGDVGFDTVITLSPCQVLDFTQEGRGEALPDEDKKPVFNAYFDMQGREICGHLPKGEILLCRDEEGRFHKRLIF